MKKQKGFTLVEVLAIIAILAVILIIAVPKINKYILSRKENSFITNVRNVLRQIEYDNMEYDTFTQLRLLDLNIKNLDKNNIDLEESVVYIENKEIYINLIGKGKYEGMYICNANINDKNIDIQNESCLSNVENIQYVELTVNLAEGITKQKFNNKYASNSTLILENPTREGYVFTGWSVSNTDAVLSGNRLTIGLNNIILTANWQVDRYTISYELNDGSMTIQNELSYTIETDTFTLNNPSKIGYTFTGWTGSNGNTPSTNVTIQKGSTGNKTYTANWQANTYSINYQLSGGIKGSNSPTSGIYGSTIEITNPTREGYVFTGWTVSGTDAILSGNRLTIGSSDITLVANWERMYTYNVSYVTQDGTILGSTSITRKEGTIENIVPPKYNNYITPSNQEITWDTENKTITFIYIPKGELIVIKNVEGTITTQNFEFTITLIGESISGTQVFSDVTFNNGVGKFLLKHGESKKFELPANISYKIEENKYDNYTPSYEKNDTNNSSLYDINQETMFINNNTKKTYNVMPIANCTGMNEVWVLLMREDLDGNYLTGAKIQLIEPNGDIIEFEENEYGYNGFAMDCNGFFDQEYTIHEVVAPEGYELAEDIKFIPNIDGFPESLKSAKLPSNIEGTINFSSSQTVTVTNTYKSN